ncbi:MAG TPA: aquaporin, partial [Candidatus Methylacidiphilales bacterium]
AVTTGALGLFEVALVWGIGVALAIHLTAARSGAHLNPAVTLAGAVWNGFPWRRVPGYWAGQLAGAFAAAALLYVLFAGALAGYEAAHGLVRGQPGSEGSAMVFGEYFPNPRTKSIRMTEARAFAAEAAGTAVLLLVIGGLTDPANRSRPRLLAPLLIGLTVTLLIALLGPLTMACFNPARDLGPRLFSACAGWGAVPFRANGWGWLTVYVIAPCVGAVIGGGLYRLLFRPGYRCGTI